MYKQVEKPKENISRAVANSITQKKTDKSRTNVIVDNRFNIPEQKLVQLIMEKQSNSTVQMVKEFKPTDSKKKSKVPTSKSKGTKYKKGQYGFRATEKKYLEKVFNKKISGTATHQSEHVIGYKVIDRVNGRKKSQQGKQHEAEAPAYYERYKAHRDHPGTGTSKQIGPSGFSSETYREDTRRLIETGGYPVAVQINQLGYAFQDEETNSRQGDDVERTQANESYKRMVMSVDEFSHYKDDGTKHTQKITFKEKVEQLIARDLQSKEIPWPYTEQILSDHLKRKYGLDLADPRLLL